MGERSHHPVFITWAVLSAPRALTSRGPSHGTVATPRQAFAACHARLQCEVGSSRPRTSPWTHRSSNAQRVCASGHSLRCSGVSTSRVRAPCGNSLCCVAAPRQAPRAPRSERGSTPERALADLFAGERALRVLYMACYICENDCEKTHTKNLSSVKCTEFRMRNRMYPIGARTQRSRPRRPREQGELPWSGASRPPRLYTSTVCSFHRLTSYTRSYGSRPLKVGAPLTRRRAHSQGTRRPRAVARRAASTAAPRQSSARAAR